MSDTDGPTGPATMTDLPPKDIPTALLRIETQLTRIHAGQNAIRGEFRSDIYDLRRELMLAMQEIRQATIRATLAARAVAPTADPPADPLAPYQQGTPNT